MTKASQGGPVLVTGQKNMRLTPEQLAALRELATIIKRDPLRLPQDVRAHLTEGRELGDSEIVGALLLWLRAQYKSPAVTGR